MTVNVMKYAGSEGSYLKAADLPQGANVEVVIESFETVDFDKDGKTQTKLVIKFANRDKKLPLNKTVRMTIDVDPVNLM